MLTAERLSVLSLVATGTFSVAAFAEQGAASAPVRPGYVSHAVPGGPPPSSLPNMSWPDCSAGCVDKSGTLVPLPPANLAKSARQAKSRAAKKAKAYRPAEGRSSGSEK